MANKRGRPPKAGPVEASGETIRADEVMSTEEFLRRAGIGYTTFLKWRSQGLKARRKGDRRLLIHGQDYINFVSSLPVSEPVGRAASRSVDVLESEGE